MKIIKSLQEAKKYQKYPLESFSILGVVQDEKGVWGALALSNESGKYVQIIDGAVFSLDQRKIKPLLGIKSNAGAPCKVKDGKRRNLYLSEADFQALTKLGNGNASQGIREALKSCRSPA